jgi:pyridoxal phosphate enzyme (YggS family)
MDDAPMDYDVAKNLARIRQGIAVACEISGRNPDEVIVVCVTKYFDHRGIVDAVRDGIKHIGENRPMEVRDKFPAADAALEEILGPGKHYTKHMIGHLQRNKVKVTLDIFDMIQSLDSVRLAEEVQMQAAKKGIERVECLIELKVSAEESKTGLDPAQLDKLVDAVKNLDRLHVLGIMGMPPYLSDPENTRPYFRRLREAFQHLKSSEGEQFEMRYLSMGMSHDFRIAVEEGANMVRIGQALFE